MTLIKLCGLSRAEDIRVANRLKPDYIGFVFYAKSKRNVTPEMALELKKMLDPSIRSVGVFVDASFEFIEALVKNKVIDLIQLHGHEDEAVIGMLKSLGVPVIKAFKATSTEAVNEALNSSADLILLDAGMGEGETFDWSLVKNVERPFFLAGGLDPENVTDAIRAIHPYAVDVSSGIETEGLKDEAKMEQFVKAVREVQ